LKRGEEEASENICMRERGKRPTSSRQVSLGRGGLGGGKNSWRKRCRSGKGVVFRKNVGPDHEEVQKREKRGR